MRSMKIARNLSLIVGSVMLSLAVQAQDHYGMTNFEATGAAEAQPAFLRGLLQLHNFEYPDARASFQEALAIDPDFCMAYWGEALSWEHGFWRRTDPEQSRAVLQRMGPTPEARAARMGTQREKDYLASIEILFGEGTQDERNLAYRDALRALHEKYPDDLDAAAFYALYILVEANGRDYAKYMRAGAIAEEILEKNPLHPGALHYAIHSYDDPVHAPLGLRMARDYIRVAPSAVHALHMGSHIYFALGMWEEGTDRNIRSFEESRARQADLDDLYDNQGYHALTWLIYSLTQQGERERAREGLALIEKQVEMHGSDSPVPRANYVAARASYIVDTQEWDSHYADVEIDLTDLYPLTVATDYYVQGLVALNRGNLDGARAALESMGGEEPVATNDDRLASPHLLRLALEGQIEFASGNSDRALALIRRATDLESELPHDYGPAVPVQPMAELLADTYLALGDRQKAVEYYELSLRNAVGRERSLTGLNRARAESMTMR